MGDALLAQHPGETVYVLKFAIGATYLAPASPEVPAAATWDPGTSTIAYPYFLQVLNVAQALAVADGVTLDVQGIAWVQGTSDSEFQTSATAYATNLTGFLRTVRSELVQRGLAGSLDTPVVLSQTPGFMFDLNVDGSCDFCHVDDVRAGEEAVACADSTVGIWDASDLDVVADNIHFDGQAQIEHGQALAARFSDLGCPTLTGSPSNLALGSGGVQTLSIDAGPSFASAPYLLLGSTSGSAPGLPVGAVLLPLNHDAYFDITLQSPNTPPLGASFGTLDAAGAATATFTVPNGSNPSLAGVVFHHAALLLDPLLAPVDTTGAVRVRLIP